MADRDRAAVDVRLRAYRFDSRGVLISHKQRRGDGHHGEGLVDLYHVHLLHRHACLGERLLRGKGRYRRDVFGMAGCLGVRDYRRQRLDAAAGCFAFSHEHERAGAGVESWRVARRYRRDARQQWR